jgi:hypothetical protein
MKRIDTPWVFLVFTLISILTSPSQAQQPGSGPGIAETPSSQAVSSRVLSFSDTVAGQPDGALSVSFAVYGDQQGSPALWTETQVVQITQGRYSVLLGSTSSTGLPSDVFSADQAHWLGVQVNGIEKRYLLVSVPYAMKAVEAERLGGLLPSQFVTVSQLQTALNNAAPASSSSSGSKPATTGIAAQASTNPPQPATDFTDNNASEVLLVTQQGPGFAIHAISAGDAAVFGENSTSTGTGLRGLASSTTGANTGILGTSASPQGIAGVFDNTGGGKILSLRSNGNEVAGVDNFGNLNAGQVQAFNFVGGGYGLTNIPNSATTATSSNVNNAIVARDQYGNFSAGQIQAFNFVGGGYGLTNIPNSATTASSLNSNNSIVSRDQYGNFSAGQIQAFNFVGGGYGLTNIPNSATTATPGNVNSAIVARDPYGNFSASQIQAFNFVGGGYGLTNIPNSATTATSANTPNTIVARDQNSGSYIGNFTTDNIQINQMAFATGMIDFSNSPRTAPVKVSTIANAPQTCSPNASLLIESDAPAGRQLFICNAAGNGWTLLGDGGGGVNSLVAADPSIVVGGTPANPGIAVADGGITSAKLASGAVTSANLAPNAVTSVSIADGTLPPAKIAGTAATLSGPNVFSATQTMPNLSVAGGLSAGTATINGALTASNSSGTGIHGDGAIGVDASTLNGVGLRVRTTGNDESAIAATFTNSQPGKTISAGISSGNGMNEQFNVDTSGNVFAAGALTAPYTNGGGVNFAQLVKLQPNGTSSPQPVVPTTTSDQGGAIGIVTMTAGANNGPLVHVAYAGVATCQFDATPTPGDYVGISHFTAGDCTDLGSSIPTVPQRQLIGRVVGATTSNYANVLLFGPERFNGNGTVSSIFTGAGLQGGPITGSGTISIGFQSVTNNMLQNNSLTVSPGLGLSGGGTVALGGSVVLQNSGALSFNGRNGNVIPAFGDYSFGQITGRASVSQMAPGTVFTNLANTFTFDQTFNADITSTGSVSANTLSASNGLSANYLTLAGNTNFTGPILTVNDNSAIGGNGSLYVKSQNNTAASFVSGHPVIMVAGTPTQAVFTVGSQGNVTVTGTVAALSFSGDGSLLTGVNATSIGGVSSANVATASALTAETAARQSADTTLQGNIGSETAARQSADAGLATSISAETAARQSDVGNLQTSINNLSAGDAKLAAANTFTASNTFTGGTEDFSGAGATLPVRALPSAQTPATCVASKELLIKTDAPAGQQLFLCDAGGTTWNLVGDGAAGGVSSFNGRNGAVSPGSGDYTFSQIAGSLAAAQLPALTGDVTAAAGSGNTVLAPTGVAPGAYSKVSVDAKGRVVSGAQASFTDFGGSIAQSQLPASVVYNNQANTFSAGQTVNGTVAATAFTGNGAGVTNVNAASLNGLASASFAQLGASSNTFTGSVTATAFTGNGGGLSNVNAAVLNGLTSASFAQLGASSNTFTGNVTASSFSGNGSAVTNVNAATVNNLQMLKLTAAITPASVGIQSCSEESFSVSGVNNGDVVLSVQLATHSPGTNIAIGGWRVPAANTVAIQFCNVSRTSSSTPAAGTYTFALLR